MPLRVSFVIPNFNYGRFIRRTIDRCLLQAERLDDAEIIVVDGGSTDETLDVLRGYGDAIAWTSEPDEGQSDAVNKGVDRAAGDIVAWVNSDDCYVEAPVLHRLVAEFEDPDVELVYGDGRLLDPEDQTVRRVGPRSGLTARNLVLDPGNPILQPTALFRRDTFRRVGGLRRDLHFAMDLDLWVRLLLEGRGVHLNEMVALAILHRAAKTQAQVPRLMREVRRVKRAHLSSLSLTVADRLRFARGWAIDNAAYLAVRSGMYRLRT